MVDIGGLMSGSNSGTQLLALHHTSSPTLHVGSCGFMLSILFKAKNPCAAHLWSYGRATDWRETKTLDAGSCLRCTACQG